MRIDPKQRTALFSVIAALVLMAIKLVVGVTTGSLGLVAEALHSGIDSVAALLTLFALGVAVRPADRRHQYGHGKAEHLAALAEATILVAASVFIVVKSIDRLSSESQHIVDAAWYAIAVLIFVMVVDAARAVVSFRTSQRYNSPALAANGWHFLSDLAGTAAVLVGLILVRAGFPAADSIAALCVAALVLVAVARIMHANVKVLMDEVPTEVELLARKAITGVEPPVQLRRLRIREAAGNTFADVVIGVPSTDVVAQGHAYADAVEIAVEEVLPNSDVVVHVEPFTPPSKELRESVRAAAMAVPGVYEVHNIKVFQVGDRTEASLHLKLPGALLLEQAHVVTSQLEERICDQVAQIDAVQTHMEPLADHAVGDLVPENEVVAERRLVEDKVLETTGYRPRKLRFINTDEGLVSFLTLALDPNKSLAAAHDDASRVKARILSEESKIVDVFVHTEP